MLRIALPVIVCAALLSAAAAPAFEIVAHRGVHQTYPREHLDDRTCTATRIGPPEHEYLENTIASMRRAFELGATMVELDIHPTADDRVVVFHDWTLDCRTEARCDQGCACDNGACITHLQTLPYLRSLDLGYGYTADGGKTYPLRGRARQPMPTLEEALDLLKEFPDRKLTINQKDTFARTVELFLGIVRKYPEPVRSRVYFETYGLDPKPFDELGIREAIYQGHGPAKACFTKYILLGWSGYFPEECRDTKLFVPLHERLGRVHRWLDSIRGVDLIWGWPQKFIERARQYGTRIYVSQVDSEADLAEVLKLPVDGIMTNRIEVIAPLFAKHRQNPYEQAMPAERARFKSVRLPFAPGTQFRVSQGAFGKESHAERGNEYSWDFDVPIGTEVLAVEDGKVLETFAPGRGGGCDPKYSELAHNLKVEHADGTVAQYVHIDSKLKPGEPVKAGQGIAVTAVNGWICSPQLHFGIYRSRDQLYASPKRETIPLRFEGLPDGLAVGGDEGIVPR